MLVGLFDTHIRMGGKRDLYRHQSKTSVRASVIVSLEIAISYAWQGGDNRL